jgi:hypothetical protein
LVTESLKTTRENSSIVNRNNRRQQSTLQNRPKERIDMYFPYLKPGKYTVRHPSTGAPSVEKWHPPGGIGKGCLREYTHTHMGVHLDIKERGKNQVGRNSANIGSFSSRDAVYLNKNK